MNIIESYEIDTPFGDIRECSKFTIEDVLTPFTLYNVMTNGDKHTISLWVKTASPEDEPATVDTDGEGTEEPDTNIDMSILIRGATIPVTDKWTYHKHTFQTFSSDLKIYFNNVGTYYIYHPQLERGNVATDWTESPLDTADKIKDAKDTADKASQDIQAYVKIFNDTIQNLVTNANGASLMTQTPDGGWTFCTADTEADVKKISELLDNFTGETSDALAKLQKQVENNNLASYVIINDDDPKNPYIELGTVVKDEATDEPIDGEFKLRITNKSIIFMQDNEPVAYIDNQQLYIEKAVIKQELTVGGFVLKQHGTRNNVGFLWKGIYSSRVSFTIDSVSYEVKNGTTWYEWADSNEWNCSSEEDVVMDRDNTYHVVDGVMEDIYGGDVIVEGDYYTVL